MVAQMDNANSYNNKHAIYVSPAWLDFLPVIA